MAAHRIDFFVSYASADRPWAEWIAWELEAAGSSVVVQAWDILAGANFVLAMHDASRAAERTIAVLSPAFLESSHCAAEWAAAFGEDPRARRRSLVPVRVRECDPGGLLGQLVYVDVVGLDEIPARDALLRGVAADRAKPKDAPGFPPGGAPGGGVVSRPDAGAAIFNVPVGTRTFEGRKRALGRVANGLGGPRAAATQVAAIHGMGGVGKTQLAARYAKVHRDDYDVVWWLRAEQPQTLHADLAALAVALGLVNADDGDEPAAVAAARGWLERNRRWLLIFDNATSPSAIAGLLPEGEGGHALITSRAHADWRSVGATPLALDVWERAESRAFLRRRTRERDARVLDAVAAALGDLPLALEQAAAYTNRQAISLAGYTQRLNDRALELLAAGQPPGYEHTVATTWSLALDEIAQHPVARGLLAACAYLAPERIPRELFAAWSENPDAGGASGVEEATGLLLDYALLSAPTDRTLSMHRLIGQIARHRAGPQARQDAAASAVRLLERAIPAKSWQHEHWASCGRLLAHGLAATEHAQALDAAPAATAAVLARLAQYYHYARAEHASARDLLERAVEIFEALYGRDRPEVASTLGVLGNVLHEQGELAAARAAQERAVEIKTALYGPDHPEVALTLGNLGIVLHGLGELTAARAAQERTLTINEAVYHPQHTQVARTVNNLGIVLQRLGELPAARAAQERALEIQEAAYGPGHPEVASTLGNLGNVLQRLGELAAARSAQERALRIIEAVYRPEHPQVARTLNNLGIVLARLGELTAARAALERALTIKHAVYGPEHPEVARTLRNLGGVLDGLGEPGAARAAHQHALKINQAVYGPDHPQDPRTVDDLGIVLQREGELPAACAVPERVEHATSREDHAGG